MYLIKLCNKNLIKVIELTKFSSIWQNTEQKRCVCVGGEVVRSSQKTGRETEVL